MAHEKRSARILALILAVIMVASALVYIFRSPSVKEGREIKFDMGNEWNDWIKYLPNSTEYVIYANLREKNETLKVFIYNQTIENLNPYVFRDFRPTSFEKIMIIDYYNYLIDVNRSKVYFAYQMKDKYKNFTLKTGISAGRFYTVVDETHPVILAHPKYAKAIIDSIHDSENFTSKYNYTSRIDGKFSYVFIVAGDLAKRTLTDNGTPIADFYFEGYRMNGSIYEKVVGIHFLKYYFFANKTENVTYYYYKNYDDYFSIARIGSYNLYNLTIIMPEIRTVIIKFGNETS